MEARKAEITQTAEEFLYYMYDTDGSRGKSIRSSRGSQTMGGFVNGNKSLQSGWPRTKMSSIDSLQATGENEVTYTLTYEEGGMGPSSNWRATITSGRIVFGENGLIDQWYPEGSPNGRLI